VLLEKSAPLPLISTKADAPDSWLGLKQSVTVDDLYICIFITCLLLPKLKATTEDVLNPSPLIVTKVPPLIGPVEGDTEEIKASSKYSK